ncbi:hypothetical protein FACS1894130_13470 [Spirochaetia bacterium]|nr:hypothetical protein FACS1894130_13470 [Spirochaetia bacterium]
MFTEALSYDDVLLQPGYSDILPRDCDVQTTLCAGVQLNAPIISAAMDTVTEERLAIAIALEGGSGGHTPEPQPGSPGTAGGQCKALPQLGHRFSGNGGRGCAGAGCAGVDAAV